MLDDFLTYIREQSLFQKNERVLLAVSGGIDSVVLTDLFSRTEFNFGIAHCHFSLRGKDSDDDQLFVENLSNTYAVPIYSRVFNTAEYAVKNQLSTQMAARELRYRWFDELLKEHHYDYICTAHHLSDSIETVLFNLSKGTGISGVRGIQPKNSKIIRPLLFTSKKDIVLYAKTHHLKWRADTSNASDQYHRNYIRHHVIPELGHINPSFEHTMKSTLERLKDVEDMALAAIDLAKKQLYHSDGAHHYFDIEQLRKLPGKTTILHHLLKPYGINYTQSKEIIRHLDESGKLFLSNSHQVNIDRTYLIVSPLSKNKDKPIVIEKGEKNIANGNFTITINECLVSKSITKDQHIGCFDLDKITFPLTVRKWQQGDRFYPLGMTQQKKVSDFLIDTKVPLNLKDNVQVLVSNDQIIWVMGYRISNQVKISKSTARVLQITLSTTN